MLCDNCKEQDAVVHLTTIQNNAVTLLHLCEKCAAEKGLESAPEPANFPLTDFLEINLGSSATEDFFIPGFHKKTTLIAEHFGFDEFYVWNFGWCNFHATVR